MPLWSGLRPAPACAPFPTTPTCYSGGVLCPSGLARPQLCVFPDFPGRLSRGKGEAQGGRAPCTPARHLLKPRGSERSRAQAAGGRRPGEGVLGGPKHHRLRFGGILSITQAQSDAVYSLRPPSSLPPRPSPCPAQPRLLGYRLLLPPHGPAGPRPHFPGFLNLPPPTPGRPQNWTAWVEGPGTPGSWVLRLGRGWGGAGVVRPSPA